MVNAMEWLHSQERYNTKEKRERVKMLVINNKNLEGHLDLREFADLEKLFCYYNQLASLDVSGCSALTTLNCHSNQLTSINFLNQLPHPEKLTMLRVYNNNIQPTDIALFSKFVNLEVLKIGTEEDDLKQGKHNNFYGSFKSWKNLSKLYNICIEATDVNEGLEYLPFSLVQNTKGGQYYHIECSSHDTNAKCKSIQDQLRPFNYDLETWQLANPELMLKSRPEYFTQEESKEQWINALATKIEKTQQELQATKTNLPDKVKKIQRLTSKLTSLEHIKNLLEQKESLKQQIEQERDIHQDAMKAMDNFYQQNPPKENNRLNNILQEFEKNYLKLNQENQQQKQKNKELEKTIELIEKLAQQRIQELESKINQLEINQEQATKIYKID